MSKSFREIVLNEQIDMVDSLFETILQAVGEIRHIDERYNKRLMSIVYTEIEKTHLLFNSVTQLKAGPIDQESQIQYDEV